STKTICGAPSPRRLRPTSYAVQTIAHRAEHRCGTLFGMPLRLIDNIAMGHHLQSVAVSRDGAQLYVGLVDENCISIVDLATGGIAGRVDLPGSPTDVQVSPNGSTALVTALERVVSGERGRAYVIDLRTNRLTADFSAGFNPQTAVFSPQGT